MGNLITPRVAWPASVSSCCLVSSSLLLPTESTEGTPVPLIGRGEDKRPRTEATKQGRDAVIEHSLDSEERAQTRRRATPEATLRGERRGQFATTGAASMHHYSYSLQTTAKAVANHAGENQIEPQTSDDVRN